MWRWQRFSKFSRLPVKLVSISYLFKAESTTARIWFPPEGRWCKRTLLDVIDRYTPGPLLTITHWFQGLFWKTWTLESLFFCFMILKLKNYQYAPAVCTGVVVQRAMGCCEAQQQLREPGFPWARLTPVKLTIHGLLQGNIYSYSVLF